MEARIPEKPFSHENWITDTLGVLPLLTLLNDIPGSVYFVKNTEGRFVECSEGFARLLSPGNDARLLMTSDRDHFPPSLAKSYADDDARVFRGGSCIVNKVELTHWGAHGLRWMTTSKFPTFDTSGQVHGVIGIMRDFRLDLNEMGFFEMGGGDHRLWRAIEFIFHNAMANPKNPVIAKAAGVSVRQLGRLFQQYLDTTPRNFVVLVKLEEACRRLTKSSQSIADVALESGFNDQSSFTVLFRKFTGITPGKFRNRWASS